MEQFSLDKLEYYINHPNIVIELDRVGPEYYQRKNPKFIYAMRIDKLKVPVPTFDEYDSYKYEIIDVRPYMLVSNDIDENISHLLEEHPEGSRVHIRVPSCEFFVQYLWPNVRVYGRQTDLSGHQHNFIELTFPRGHVAETKVKTFGELRVSTKVTYSKLGEFVGSTHATMKAFFEFLSDDVSDVDIRRALGYLKLLGAEAYEENMCLGIAPHYNRDSLTVLKRFKRIIDVL